MNDIKEIVLITLVTLVIFGVPICGLIGLAAYLNSLACHAKYESYEPQYGIMSGCRVVWEGKLTPVENLGFRDIK